MDASCSASSPCSSTSACPASSPGSPRRWWRCSSTASSTAPTSTTARRCGRRSPIDHGVQGGLARLADEVGADRAYLLPARGDASSGLPDGLLAHVIAHRRPVLLTEAASYRAQRRSNIETASRMLIPGGPRRPGRGGGGLRALRPGWVRGRRARNRNPRGGRDRAAPHRGFRRPAGTTRGSAGASRTRAGEVAPTAAGALVATTRSRRGERRRRSALRGIVRGHRAPRCASARRTPPPRCRPAWCSLWHCLRWRSPPGGARLGRRSRRVGLGAAGGGSARCRRGWSTHGAPALHLAPIDAGLALWTPVVVARRRSRGDRPARSAVRSHPVPLAATAAHSSRPP